MRKTATLRTITARLARLEQHMQNLADGVARKFYRANVVAEWDGGHPNAQGWLAAERTEGAGDA